MLTPTRGASSASSWPNYLCRCLGQIIPQTNHKCAYPVHRKILCVPSADLTTVTRNNTIKTYIHLL